MIQQSGDFAKLVEKDLEMLGVAYEDITSNKLTKQKLKTISTFAAFSFLLNKQETHNKIKYLQYEKLTIQKYLVMTS